jgi:hypothetical protein
VPVPFVACPAVASRHKIVLCEIDCW